MSRGSMVKECDPKDRNKKKMWIIRVLGKEVSASIVDKTGSSRILLGK